MNWQRRRNFKKRSRRNGYQDRDFNFDYHTWGAPVTGNYKHKYGSFGQSMEGWPIEIRASQMGLTLKEYFQAMVSRNEERRAREYLKGLNRRARKLGLPPYTTLCGGAVITYNFAL